MKLMNVKSPDEVKRIINENFHPLPVETLDFEEAGGRHLAQDIFSSEDVPGFNRSTVDGFAVRAKDTFGSGEGLPALIKCKGEILMGHVSGTINAGECYQIHTGGMLPEGADAVVMVEDTEMLQDTVQCYRQVAPRENVIHRGEDVQNGQQILSKGKLLRAPELGVLASLGITEVTVHRQPVLGLLPSGDELVPWDTKVLEPGKIRNSNTPALARIGGQSGAKVINGGILSDRFDDFLNRSQAMLNEADFLVFSGGSSVGTRDFTALTMKELGQPGLLVEGISIQPGKPTLLANCNGKPVLGLPGHPVSAIYVFMIIGSFILQRLSGAGEAKPSPTLRAVLNRNVPSRSGRTDYVRVKLHYPCEASIGDELPQAGPIFGRSGMLRTLAEADGFFVISPEKEGVSAGEIVEVIIIE